MSAIKTVLVPIHRAGWPFIALFALVALVLGMFSSLLGWAMAVLTLWCVYFFRDPDRVTPVRDGLVISPADGVVQMIAEAVPPPELGMGDRARTRVSIFLNVFDVHVNRVPADGTVERVEYRPGTFVNAALDKASDGNERMSILMRTAEGQEIAFVQIAGLVARRIICNLMPGMPVRAGERFGLIRFGSRTDIYLPDGAAPLVVVGQRAVGGETVIANTKSTEPARIGEVR